VGVGRKSALKKRYPRGIRSSSDEEGDVFQVGGKARQKPKELPWIEGAGDKGLNKKKRAGGKRNSYSSEEEPVKVKLGRGKNGKPRGPWSGAKKKDSGMLGAPRFGRKVSPRFGRKSNIPLKKPRPKFRKWDDSEDDSYSGFGNKKRTSSEDDDFSIPRKKKASISDGPAVKFRKKHKKVQSEIRKFPKKAPPQKPQPPTPEEALKGKKPPVGAPKGKKPPVAEKVKLEDKKTNLMMLKLQQDVKKLREELKEAKKAPKPDTVAISKAKLAGLLEGKVINDAGGVEDAIESLVNQRQELEGQLVEMRDKLQKKNTVEKNLEKMKDELQRNLERIEKNSRAMSPNINNAGNNNTIYRLSQRIAALEQEQKEIRHHEMIRYSLPPPAPVYWRSPPAVHQPLVQIHQPTAWGSQGQYQARAVPRQTHFNHAPGVPLDQPHSPHDRSSERSFVDGGDIAELCSALAATVDLVKKVINVDT